MFPINAVLLSISQIFYTRIVPMRTCRTI